MRTLILAWSVLLCCLSHAGADLYQWTDRDGVIHIVDDAAAVPETYRDRVTVYRTATPSPAESAVDTLLSPSRTYAANSQGAFAQQLAFDLGLIKHPDQDALAPLRGVGIQPAGGWRLNEPLTPEALYEIIAAARRAADAKRLPLSPDGAEAVVRQAAAPFLPSPTAQPSSPAEEYAEDYADEEEPDVIVIEQPPQIIEVIREPAYLPPVVVGVPLFPSHHRHRHTRQKGGDQFTPPPPPTGPHTTHPGPTHLPPRATHLPTGSVHPSPFPSPFFRR